MTNACRAQITPGRTKVPKIVVGGIGTGGHYFPAAVVAQALQDRSFDVVFLVRSGFVEEKVARSYGLTTFSIEARPFYGRSMMEKLLFIISLIGAVYRLQALTHDAIAFAFGGFGAVPLIISAMLNHSRFYIFEPNRVPGRATKLFASAAQRVFLGMPVDHKLGDRSMVTGIPVRRQFKQVHADARQVKKAREVRVLFYGGSQGARRLNDMAIALQPLMSEEWCFTIISGPSDYERVARLKRGNTRVLSFAERPWEEIGAADVVVSRAGALAGYEILCLNKKAIFVPFPHAVDNHQYYNAEYFSRVGDAIFLEEEDLTVEILAMKIRELHGRRLDSKTDIIRNAEQIIVDLLMGDLIDEEL